MVIKRNHYRYCLPPFVALLGIYVFDIIGSFEVIGDEAVFTWTYYCSLAAIVVCFYLFYIAVFRLKTRLFIDWRTVRDTPVYQGQLLLIVLWVFSFCILLLYYQRHGLPAVFQLDFSRYADIYAIRGERSTNLPEGMHWYRFAFNTVPAFTFVYTYVLKYVSPTRTHKLVFYANSILVMIFASFTLHKSPFMYLVLYLLIVDLVLRDRPPTLKKFVGYTSAGLGTVVLMMFLYLRNKGLGEFALLVPGFLLRRICVVYTMAHAHIIQIFPREHDFFMGRALFPNPHDILPFEPVNLSQFLGSRVYGVLMNYACPSFSEGYANFGIPGCALVVIVMFVQIFVVQAVFKKFPRNPIYLALYVVLIPQMLGYGFQGIEAIIDVIYILFGMAVVFLYYFLRDASRCLANRGSAADEAGSL